MLCKMGQNVDFYVGTLWLFRRGFINEYYQFVGYELLSSLHYVKSKSRHSQ